VNQITHTLANRLLPVWQPLDIGLHARVLCVAHTARVRTHLRTRVPRLRDNVAVAPWTPAPRATGLINEQLLVSATWYDVHGHVLASFHDSLTRITKAYSP
jgi:hypothetical protein